MVEDFVAGRLQRVGEEAAAKLRNKAKAKESSCQALRVREASRMVQDELRAGLAAPLFQGLPPTTAQEAEVARVARLDTVAGLAEVTEVLR